MKLKQQLLNQLELINWINDEFKDIINENAGDKKTVKRINTTFEFINEEFIELLRLSKLKEMPKKIVEPKEKQNRIHDANNLFKVGASLHHRMKRYESRINLDGKKLFLHYWDTVEDANLAYRIAYQVKLDGTYSTRFKSEPALLRNYIKEKMTK